MIKIDIKFFIIWGTSSFLFL